MADPHEMSSEPQAHPHRPQTPSIAVRLRNALNEIQSPHHAMRLYHAAGNPQAARYQNALMAASYLKHELAVTTRLSNQRLEDNRRHSRRILELDGELHNAGTHHKTLQKDLDDERKLRADVEFSNRLLEAQIAETGTKTEALERSLNEAQSLQAFASDIRAQVAERNAQLEREVKELEGMNETMTNINKHLTDRNIRHELDYSKLEARNGRLEDVLKADRNKRRTDEEQVEIVHNKTIEDLVSKHRDRMDKAKCGHERTLQNLAIERINETRETQIRHHNEIKVLESSHHNIIEQFKAAQQDKAEKCSIKHEDHVKNWQRWNHNLRQKKDEVEGMLRNLQQELANKNIEVEGLSEQLNAGQQELKRHRQELVDVGIEMAGAQATARAAQEDAHKEVDHTMANLKDDNARLAQENEGTSQRLYQLEELCAAYIEQAAAARAEAAQLSDEVAQLRQCLAEKERVAIQLQQIASGLISPMRPFKPGTSNESSIMIASASDDFSPKPHNSVTGAKSSNSKKRRI